MNKLKDKKIIATTIVLVILFISSIIIYGRDRNKIFTEQNINNIFVDTDEQLADTFDDSLSNKEILVSSEKEANNIPKIFVEIKGEVLSPDVYELEEGSIVKDLIEIAGGLTEEADISNINRAKKLQNHELVIISNINDENISAVIDDVNLESTNLININSADINELQKITGIGEVKAKSILEYREKNGGFKIIDEIKNVDGIGEKTFEKIKDEIIL